MNLLGQIKQTALLTDFEFKKLFRQKSAYMGVVVILMLTGLACLGLYMEKMRGHAKTVDGQAMIEFMNGLAFSQIVLSPAIYVLLPMVVGIFTAISFAGEFQNGLVRTITIRPVPKWSILLSKLASMILYSYLLLFMLLLVSYIAGGLMFDWNGELLMSKRLLGMGGDRRFYIIATEVAWKRLLLSYFMAGFPLISISAGFLMCAVIFKRTATSAIVPLGVYYTCYILDSLPFMEFMKKFLPTRYIMFWRYALMENIGWDRIWHDIPYITGYTLAYFIVACLIFKSTDT